MMINIKLDTKNLISKEENYCQFTITTKSSLICIYSIAIIFQQEDSNLLLKPEDITVIKIRGGRIVWTSKKFGSHFPSSLILAKYESLKVIGKIIPQNRKKATVSCDIKIVEHFEKEIRIL